MITSKNDIPQDLRKNEVVEYYDETIGWFLYHDGLLNNFNFNPDKILVRTRFKEESRMYELLRRITKHETKLENIRIIIQEMVNKNIGLVNGSGGVSDKLHAKYLRLCRSSQRQQKMVNDLKTETNRLINIYQKKIDELNGTTI